MTSAPLSAAPSVLFFLCLNDRGGAEMSMIKIAQGLAARGEAVTLAVYGARPDLARDMGFGGQVIDLGTRRSFATVGKLRRILLNGSFTTVITALTHTNIAAIAAVLGTKTRVIATEHGIDGIAACEKSPLFKFVTRIAYARATVIVAVSQGLMRRWQEILPGRAKVLTIYNPAAPEQTAVPPPAHAWLAQKEIPTLLGLGRLKEEKNFALLIRAFAKMKKPTRLIILGEGEERPYLENLICELNLQNKILLPGFQPDPAAWLAHAALLVSPSRREGFGNALVEALAYGIPVVATDCPFGPAEILQNGKYGRLVPSDDADAMAQAIDDTLACTVDAQSLRARAADFAAPPCIDLYLRLVNNRPSPSEEK